MSLAENEKQTKRNIRRKIDDIADLLYHYLSKDGENVLVTQHNMESIAKTIISEVFGVNTADIDTPVDEDNCQKAEDIIAQIKAKQHANKELKDKRQRQQYDDMVNDIRALPDPIDEFFDKVDIKLENTTIVDPFDDAMSILEKK